MTPIPLFDDINSLADWWDAESVYTACSCQDSINHELRILMTQLEHLYNKKDDFIPWGELDRDMSFQFIIDIMVGFCISDECICIMAIFCLDRGLHLCQMNSLKDIAYENYLLSSVISAKRLSE